MKKKELKFYRLLTEVFLFIKFNIDWIKRIN